MKEKLRLFYGISKWHLFGAGAVIILAAFLFLSAQTARRTVLAGVLLDCPKIVSQEAVEALGDGFLEHLGRDPKLTRVRIVHDLPYTAEAETPGDNFAAIDALTEYIAAGRLDFLAGPQAAMENLAYSDFFEDLRNVLSPEQLEAFAGDLRYMDLAVVRQLEQMAENKSYPENFTLPDPGKPEEMEEPVPVFVDLTRQDALAPIFGEEPVLFAVARNTARPETARDFMEYLAGRLPPVSEKE